MKAQLTSAIVDNSPSLVSRTDPDFLVSYHLDRMVKVVEILDKCDRWPECRCRVLVTDGDLLGGEGQSQWSMTLGQGSVCGRFYLLKPR